MIRTVASLGVVALLVLGSPAWAQEEPAAERAAPAPDAKPDPAVEAWVRTLAGKIADQNQVIRQSAHQGLTAVGNPALPHLRSLAESSDVAVSAEAKRVIARIERGGRRGGDDERPGRGAGPGQGGRRNPVDEVLGQLNLNDEQRKKVDEIQSRHTEKQREIMGQMRDGSMSREEGMAAFQELRNATNKEMKGVLNEEQFKKYEEGTRNMRGGFGGPRRRRGDG